MLCKSTHCEHMQMSSSNSSPKFSTLIAIPLTSEVTLNPLCSRALLQVVSHQHAELLEWLAMLSTVQLHAVEL
jgi:hypothetical protein